MRTSVNTFILFMCSIVGMGTVSANEIVLWREPAPIVKEGKYYSLIVDRGQLQKAVRNTNNDYLFSEKGNGIKPLVLIGSPLEISEFLIKNETRGIENHIKELPDIYMGITNYVPQKRFTGLFPLHDLLTKSVEQALIFVPVGTILTDIAGIPSDLNEMYDVIKTLKNKDKSDGKLLYVKFSYLPEDGMKKVGRKTVSFGKILKQMQDANK
ncbi:hypothetical protein [Yersinia enterocolitica]|nr:hypothetical protein [Yersinia enterocolitica]SQA41014.1 Uncharacterised protein [Yersinia enterocolitica]SUP66307.1 Uncharacterised protein [Yersinia enterocolitica]HDM8272387.1 hypothetical protein [Yersinia enterocolitica]HED5566861.1 hypothetical protein [Yersinia enterocolitica]